MTHKRFIEDLSWAKANALLNEAIKDLSKADLVPKNFPVKSIMEERVNEEEAKYYLDKAVRELAKLRLTPSSDIATHNILQELSEKTNVWSRYVKKEDYDVAYNEYKADYAAAENYERELSFLKEVVKEHGTDTQSLQKAIESIAKQDYLFPNETPKLLQDTLKTDEYKKAFEAEQGKTTEQENIK